MLDKINKKKNVNVLSWIQKHDVINTKNLHIVTRQGTKIRSDNTRISTIKDKNDYPNLAKQKQLYNDTTNIFKEFSRQEEADNSRQSTIKELIRLVQYDKVVSQFFDLLYNMKHHNNTEKQTKNICSLNQKDKSDAGPLVDLEIEGYHVRQVVLDFGSQVNTMTHDTCEQ